jgi:predicted exporter
LEPKLKALIASHAIAGFDDAARYVPSHARQLARQERLPDREKLKTELASAAQDTPFREGVFEPFLDDVERARTLPPLTVEKVRNTPLGASVDILVLEREGKATALVTFVDVQAPEVLAAAARDAGPDVLLLDLKDASESLVAHQRERILWSLAIASGLLVAVIAFTLKRPGRVARVLAPMALTTLLVLAVLRVSDVSLNLFHLIALILAAGLGLDYALFFEHASHDEREQRRTLHAVLVCSLSTLMTFALLALSTTPVLRAIGLTVSLGVIFNFVFALLLTRPAKSNAAS